MNTRRQFLICAPLGVLVAAAACSKDTPPPPATQSTPPPPAAPTPSTPGAPPTFGTGAGAGPVVTPATFAEAEKLVQVTMTPAERQQAADTWRTSMAQYLERRTGPRKVALADTYISRLERLDSKIRSVITLTKEHALARAQQADAEIAAGKYRGPLHGIPYGVKDLLDTKDIPTTYGAEPFKNRVPSADSAVVR